MTSHGIANEDLVVAAWVLGAALFVILMVLILLAFIVYSVLKRLRKAEKKINKFYAIIGRAQRGDHNENEPPRPPLAMTSLRKPNGSLESEACGVMTGRHTPRSAFEVPMRAGNQHADVTDDVTDEVSGQPPTESSSSANDEIAEMRPAGKRDASKSFSAFFGHRAVSIFGDVHPSQMYHLCQDYFEVPDSDQGSEVSTGRRKSVEEVCIESIQIEPLFRTADGGVDNPSFSLLDEITEATKRPRSYYLTLDQQDPLQRTSNKQQTMFDFRQGMFERRAIGPEGGEVALYGIKLIVPQGALEVSRELSVGVFWSKDHYPVLRDGQAVLSPVVVCEPHGLTFKQPVQIVIPHCAVNIRRDWSVKLMTSDTLIHQSVRWRELTIADYESRVIDDTNIRIDLKHFTLYTVLGETQNDPLTSPAAKSVRLVAFAPPLSPGRLFKVRVYCVKHYEDEMKHDLSGETAMDGMQVDALAPLIIHDNGGNVELNLDCVSEGWTQKNTHPQCLSSTSELDFESIWHALTPCCSFALESTDESSSQILCEFLAFQASRPNQKQRITVTEEVKRGYDVPSRMFPAQLRKKLVEGLDPPHPLGQDWHAVAGKLELAFSTVTWLDSRPNPTQLVLREWEQQQRSLYDLYTCLTEIGCIDLTQDMEEYIQSEDV